MGKNIVICCDGTGNQFGEHNTNVVNSYQLLTHDETQATYYDPGLGTFSVAGHTRLGKKIGELLGLAFGYGLQQNLQDAYGFLMHYYEPGDRLFLLGFSRGAYTVRCLAGMICKMGILRRGNHNLIPYVSNLNSTEGNDDIAAAFKETYSHECDVHCIGVWDTVGSLGYAYSWHRFFDVTLHPEVRHGYHAMSIDERRRKFPVTLWDETREVPGQIIEQVWFPGVHSDVGGSYPERGLSDGAMKWMLTKCEGAGLKLKPGWLEHMNPQPGDPDSLHESLKGGWYLLPPWPFASKRRVIPEGSWIHRSAVERKEAGVSYAPKNWPKDFVVVSEDAPAADPAPSDS